MKMIQQLLINDENVSKEALTQDGPSVLGKYIMGAKNNFRGFSTGHETNSPSLTVTVHHEEEEASKEKLDSKPESDKQENQAGECGADGSQQVTHCDVVKMEEGRAKLEPGDEAETEKKEETEADNSDTDNKGKEEVAAGTSFNYAEEKLETEPTQGQAEKIREEDTFTVTITEHAETITDSNEKMDTKRLVRKFEDIELKEKNVEDRGVKNNTAGQSVVMEVYEKPGAKKIIPSPTGSSGSQDTGFGSREGEGSVDGC